MSKTGRNFGINLKEVIDRFIWTIELCHIWNFFIHFFNRTFFLTTTKCDDIFQYIFTDNHHKSINTVYNRTVSCLQKFEHFWMIIRDLFFESGSTEATKIKKNTAKVCHIYFLSNNSALFEHWNLKSPFKHRWMVCFRSKKGVKNLFFLHEFLKLCQIFSHYLMK